MKGPEQPPTPYNTARQGQYPAFTRATLDLRDLSPISEEIDTQFAVLLRLSKETETSDLDDQIRSVFRDDDVDWYTKMMADAVERRRSSYIAHFFTKAPQDAGQRIIRVRQKLRYNEAAAHVTLEGEWQDVTDADPEDLDLVLSEQLLQRAEEFGKTGHYTSTYDLRSLDCIERRWSKNLFRLLGMEPQASLSPLDEPLPTVLRPKQLERFRSVFFQAIKARKPDSKIKVVASPKEGPERTVLFEMEFTYVEDKHRVETFGIARDITEVEKAREDLEARQSLVLRAEVIGRSGHFYYDVANAAMTWSDSLYALLGMTDRRPELLGLDRLEGVLAAGEFERITKLSMEMMRQRVERFDSKARIIRPSDGEARELHVETSFEYGSSGLPQKVFGAVQDITSLDATRRDLAFRDELFKRAEALGKIGHFLIDAKTGYQYWSPSLYEMNGISEEDREAFTAEGAEIEYLPGEQERLNEDLKAAIAKGVTDQRSTVRSYRYKSKDVLTKVMDRHLTYAPDGSLSEVFGLIQDITDQVNAEAERKRLERRLEDAQRSESLNFFAGSLAHELANMLQPAVTFAELASQSIDRSDQDAALRHMKKVSGAVARSMELAHRSLAYVRVDEAGPQPMRVDVALEGVRGFLSGVITSHLDWTVDPSIAKQVITIESTGLTQVLMNLIRNAVQAGGERTKIEISVHGAGSVPGFATVQSEQSGIIISVKDNGPGIPEADQARIFEPLFTTKGDGTGLGLSITNTIVKRWNGHLTCFSEQDKGTEIGIFLPAYASSDGPAS